MTETPEAAAPKNPLVVAWRHRSILFGKPTWWAVTTEKWQADDLRENGNEVEALVVEDTALRDAAAQVVAAWMAGRIAPLDAGEDTPEGSQVLAALADALRPVTSPE
jgi:hypothetical protein